MSECVVRMEMPLGCHWRTKNLWAGLKDCPASDYEEGECLLDPLERNTADYVGKRPPWCPIICSIPEGHGRLADVNELEAIMFEDEGTTYKSGWNNGLRAAMQYLTTIVPAEAERSEKDGR